jgi:hypothetical protein
MAADPQHAKLRSKTAAEDGGVAGLNTGLKRKRRPRGTVVGRDRRQTVIEPGRRVSPPLLEFPCNPFPGPPCSRGVYNVDVVILIARFGG